jgi:hypothetical protein
MFRKNDQHLLVEVLQWVHRMLDEGDQQRYTDDFAV